MKAYKGNFVNHPLTRLPNPAKSKIRRISKLTLDKNRICLHEKLKLSRWENTIDIINLFEKIEEKHLHTLREKCPNMELFLIRISLYSHQK